MLLLTSQKTGELMPRAKQQRFQTAGTNAQHVGNLAVRRALRHVGRGAKQAAASRVAGQIRRDPVERIAPVRFALVRGIGTQKA